MYLIRLYTDKEYQLACNIDALYQIIWIFEKERIEYKVSNRNLLKPEYFGWGGFEYWLNPEDKFTGR